MAADPADTGLKQAGRWPKGRSGNPAGRRPGSRNRVLEALDKIGAEAAAAVLQAAVTAAVAGDVRAQELILSRTWPKRDRPVVLQLPAVTSAAEVVQAMAATVAAIGLGAITPSEAQSIATVLIGARQAIELGEVEARLAALEAALGPDRNKDHT